VFFFLGFGWGGFGCCLVVFGFFYGGFIFVFFGFFFLGFGVFWFLGCFVFFFLSEFGYL